METKAQQEVLDLEEMKLIEKVNEIEELKGTHTSTGLEA